MNKKTSVAIGIRRPLSTMMILLLALALLTPVLCQAAWQLTWSDEFTQADGSSPDPAKWGFDVGGGGFGNNQQEYDTSRTNNARIEGGHLVIEAKQETYTGTDNVTRNYTSARMLTKGKWSWTYGRIEASIKIPRGQGIWPAFWTLGTNIDSVGWPKCGEIDIMENIGNTSDQATEHGTIHGPQTNSCGGDYNCGGGVGGTYTLSSGALADAYHIYAVEWTTNQIKWFLDDHQFFTATPANLPGNSSWPFTVSQFVILNVAVGGNWPGYPDGTTVFPQQMLVDYVRVYNFVAAVPNPPTGLNASPGNAKVYLNWNASTGASGYNIKRATTSGGTYVTVGSSDVNSFTDTSVANCATYYYVVTATNSLGESTNSTEQAVAQGAFATAVNAGGSAAGQFVADANVSGGTIAAPTASVIDTTGVTNPAPQSVYQTERYGTFTYTFGGLTPGTSYKVRLHLVEYYWNAANARKFNVAINGTPVLTNYDIFAAAGGQNKAIVREFNSTPNGSGQIIIAYSVGTADQPKASGIEILLPQTGTPVAGNNGPISAGMTLNLTASTVPGANYNWTGPNGFTSTNQNPSIVNAATNASGLFSVTATTGACVSAPGTTTATINPPANVTVQFLAGNLILNWPGGVLQSATNACGPWDDVSGAVSPLTNPAALSQEFYRLRFQ